MAMTIHPAVSEGRRKWLAESMLFLGGAFVGALASVLVAVVVVHVLTSIVPDTAVMFLAGSLISLAVLHDLGVPLPMPNRRQQVPERLRDLMPRGVVALVFGFMLGVGFLTLFTYSAQLAFVVAAPFANSASIVVLAAALFAIGKSMVLLESLRTSTLSGVGWLLSPTSSGLLATRAATAAVSTVVVIALLLNP